MLLMMLILRRNMKKINFDKIEKENKKRKKENNLEMKKIQKKKV